MCNAWNHAPGCTCGWGGDGHSGGGGGGSYYPTVYLREIWPHHNDKFCRPTTCPKCGEQVFFVRHNGGSVWFDELGPPWPKHKCFTDDEYGKALRSTLTEQTQTKVNSVFGIVVEIAVIHPRKRLSWEDCWRIVVYCSNGTKIDREFETAEFDLTTMPGSFVTVVYQKQNGISLIFTKPNGSHYELKETDGF
jgi:hypothetical protein